MCSLLPTACVSPPSPLAPHLQYACACCVLLARISSSALGIGVVGGYATASRFVVRDGRFRTFRQLRLLCPLWPPGELVAERKVNARLLTVRAEWQRLTSLAQTSHSWCAAEMARLRDVRPRAVAFVAAQRRG